MTAHDSDNAGHSDLVSVTEAAARLGKSERTLRRWIASGKLATVDLGGQAYVQLAGTGTPPDTTGTIDQMAAKTPAHDRRLSDTLAESLRDTIRRQDREIDFLRGELTAARETVNTLTRMLPAPGIGNSTERKPGSAPVWILIVIVAAILAAGGYALWLMK